MNLQKRSIKFYQSENASLLRGLRAEEGVLKGIQDEHARIYRN
jgi:hypothetical protein